MYMCGDCAQKTYLIDEDCSVVTSCMQSTLQLIYWEDARSGENFHCFRPPAITVTSEELILSATRTEYPLHRQRSRELPTLGETVLELQNFPAASGHTSCFIFNKLFCHPVVRGYINRVTG